MIKQRTCTRKVFNTWFLINLVCGYAEALEIMNKLRNFTRYVYMIS